MRPIFPISQDQREYIYFPARANEFALSCNNVYGQVHKLLQMYTQMYTYHQLVVIWFWNMGPVLTVSLNMTGLTGLHGLQLVAMEIESESSVETGL